MADVPSINEKPAEIPDVDDNPTTQWVDPMFLEKAETTLADDPNNETEIPDEPAAAPVDDQPAADDEEAEAADADDDAEDDEEAGDETPEAEQAAGDDQPAKPRRRRSRKRQESRASLREREQALREENIALNARLEALEEMRTPPPAADDDAADEHADADEGEGEAEQAPPAAPKLEDYDYDTDEWATAFTEWSVENTNRAIAATKREAEQAEQAASAEQAAMTEREQRLQNWNDRQADARERYDDYDDVVYAEDVEVSERVVALLIESDVGPDIAYHLAANQDESKALEEMSDAKMALHIGRLETRFLSEAEDASAEQAADSTDDDEPPAAPAARRPVTKAPPPVTPVSTGAGASTRNPDSMSMDDYAEARRSGRIK